jgi:hypothetical protein
MHQCHAILIGSNLKDADLTDANFTGALLEKANFEGAGFSQKTIWPSRFSPEGAGAIPINRYEKYEHERWVQEKKREEEQQKIDMTRESRSLLPPHFPAAYYRKLKSAWDHLSDFTYATVGNKTTGVNPTECSTIELIGPENVFTKLILRVDYVNESSYNWAGYVVDLVSLFLDQDYKAAKDWLNSQEALDRSSLSDIQAEITFGDCLLSFCSKHLEGAFEFSFARVQR